MSTRFVSGVFSQGCYLVGQRALGQLSTSGFTSFCGLLLLLNFVKAMSISFYFCQFRNALKKIFFRLYLKFLVLRIGIVALHVHNDGSLVYKFHRAILF